MSLISRAVLVLLCLSSDADGSRVQTRSHQVHPSTYEEDQDSQKSRRLAMLLWALNPIDSFDVASLQRPWVAASLPHHRHPPITLSSSLPPLKAAVIIPGFLNDQKDFEPLARSLSARGLPTAVVPMPLWHWIPQVGGRSVRPILERIDHAVRHVAAMGDVRSTEPLVVPPISYNIFDFWQDFTANPGGVAKVGGSDRPDEYPTDVTPRGTFPSPGPPQGRVALIGHSAAGWMARIYLSERAYGGKAYGGAALIHSLVTLGTPHLAGAGVPFYSVEWANREQIPSSVRCLAIGSRGTPGNSSGSLTLGAYSFCTPEGTGGEALDGDGLTTLESAIAVPGAEQMVLDGVTHYPWTSAPFADQLAPDLAKAYRAGKPWYGSESILDKWLPWLLEGPQTS